MDMVIGMNRSKALKVVKLLLFYRCLYLFSCYWQLNEKKNETDTAPEPETESRPKTASGDFSEKCQLASEPVPSQTKNSSEINTFLNLNLRQGDYMNPVNFVDPMGLQEKEFYVMITANPDEVERIEYLQNQARKGYAKGAAAATAAFVMSPLSAPTIIALCGSGLIYSGLENYSDRRMEGQSELEAKTGAVVDTLTLGTYPIIKGRDAGTGDTVSDEQKLKIVSDLVPYTIGGAVGIVTGSLFSRLNPSTSQLMDEAFQVLDFKPPSTGGYGVYPVETQSGVRWKNPYTGKFVKAPSKGKTVLGHVPEYVEMGKKIDGTYLEIPKTILDKLFGQKKFKEIWKIDKLFVTEAFKRGDQIIFATDWTRKWSYFARELWHLRKLGMNVFEQIKKLWGIK